MNELLLLPERARRKSPSPCCVHTSLQKKEDLSAKAKELVVLCVLCVSNHAEVRSITNISSLSVFAGAMSAISDQRQPPRLVPLVFTVLHDTTRSDRHKAVYISRCVISLSLSFYFFFGACVSSSFVGVRKPRGLPDCFIRAWDSGTFPFTSLDILIPDHTPVPCMESVAPTAYAIPSAAVLMDQKIAACYVCCWSCDMRRCLRVMMWIKSDVMRRVVRGESAAENAREIPSRTFEERREKNARKHT